MLMTFKWQVIYIYIIGIIMIINPLWTKFFFRRFTGHNLRYVLFVYRLIGAAFIGNFFDDPFLKNRIEIETSVLLGVKGLIK